jgi:general stress protein YciG
MEDMNNSDNVRSNRGFATMNVDRQKEIARKGGRAAHAKGTAHEFTTDEARAAGQKGGQRVSSNREHMSRIGRIGGKRSAGRRIQNKTADGSNSPDMNIGGEQPGQRENGSVENANTEQVNQQSEATEQSAA